MAKKQTLKAAPRARTGSGKLNQMRREGWLPSVIYGRGMETVNLKVDAKTFGEMLAASSSENLVINLEVEGAGRRLAFLQTVQHNPLTGKILHADFLSIDENTPITAHVPVHFTGNSIGVKLGGLLDVYQHSIEVTCLPNDLPEILEFDVTDLEIGQTMHLADVVFPEGVTPVLPLEVAVVTVAKQGAGQEEEEEAAAEEAEQEEQAEEETAS